MTWLLLELLIEAGGMIAVPTPRTAVPNNFPSTELLPTSKSFVTFTALATQLATMQKVVKYMCLSDFLFDLSESVLASVAFIVELLDATGVTKYPTS